MWLLISCLEEEEARVMALEMPHPVCPSKPLSLSLSCFLAHSSHSLLVSLATLPTDGNDPAEQEVMGTCVAL